MLFELMFYVPERQNQPYPDVVCASQYCVPGKGTACSNIDTLGFTTVFPAFNVTPIFCRLFVNDDFNWKIN